MLHTTTSMWRRVDIQSSDRRWMTPLRVTPIHGTPDQRSELAGCSTWNQYQTKGPNTKQWIVLKLRTVVISCRRIRNAKRIIHEPSTATHFGKDKWARSKRWAQSKRSIVTPHSIDQWVSNSNSRGLIIETQRKPKNESPGITQWHMNGKNATYILLTVDVKLRGLNHRYKNYDISQQGRWYTFNKINHNNMEWT